MVDAGHPDDFIMGRLSDYSLFNQEPSVWFKELLSRTNIIAFPSWWAVEAEKLKHITMFVEASENMRVPFPRCSPEFMGPAWDKWYPQQTAEEMEQWQKDHRELSLQVCEATPFPEMIPYSSTFIALEPVERRRIASVVPKSRQPTK